MTRPRDFGRFPRPERRGAVTPSAYATGMSVSLLLAYTETCLNDCEGTRIQEVVSEPAQRSKPPTRQPELQSPPGAWLPVAAGRHCDRQASNGETINLLGDTKLLTRCAHHSPRR